MMSPVIICLVSPGHLGSNPRLVKEADALAAAGYHVRVIYGDSFPPARVRDRAILAGAVWQASAMSLQGWRRVAAILRQRTAKILFSWGWRSAGIATLAHHPLTPSLEAAARAIRADLYIGHCLAALPAVVAAARHHRAKGGFDAEDFHSGELLDEGNGRLENEIARVIEKHLLPQCHHLTAASPLIAAAYQETCGVNPLTILNVFPLREAADPQPAPGLPAFYWFSQTVGPGRGLEAFIGILRQLQRPCRLDLRGHVSGAYQQELEQMAAGSRITLHFLPPDLPQTMVRHAAGYTAGLALEQRQPRNRDICLTNKAFTYLLAGVPVILSQTSAQELLAVDLGPAALLLDLEKSAEAAVSLARWLDQPGNQERARSEAFQLGRRRFCWDSENEKVLFQVASVLGKQAPGFFLNPTHKNVTHG